MTRTEIAKKQLAIRAELKQLEQAYRKARKEQRRLHSNLGNTKRKAELVMEINAIWNRTGVVLDRSEQLRLQAQVEAGRRTCWA